MSVNLTKFTRALRIYPSQYPIPSPYVLTTGEAIDNSVCDIKGCSLESSSDFIQKGVSVGDIVYVYDALGTTFQFITVVTFISNNTLIYINDPISKNFKFTIYQQSAQSGLGNRGCTLYFPQGNSSTFEVKSITDTTIFSADFYLNESELFPIQLSHFIQGNSEKPFYALW